MRARVYAPGGRALIGHLETSDLRELRARFYEIALDEVETSLGPIGPHATIAPIGRRFVALGIERRGVSVNEIDIRTMHWRGHHRIPDYAEEVLEPHRDQRSYHWPVLVAPDREIAELVFELDAFEPTGEPCGAARADEAWWMKRETKFHTGGFVAGSGLTKPIISVNVSANAADLSKTAKSVEEALRQAGQSMQKTLRPELHAGARRPGLTRFVNDPGLPRSRFR